MKSGGGLGYVSGMNSTTSSTAGLMGSTGAKHLNGNMTNGQLNVPAPPRLHTELIAKRTDYLENEGKFLKSMIAEHRTSSKESIDKLSLAIEESRKQQQNLFEASQWVFATSVTDVVGVDDPLALQKGEEELRTLYRPNEKMYLMYPMRDVVLGKTTYCMMRSKIVDREDASLRVAWVVLETRTDSGETRAVSDFHF